MKYRKRPLMKLFGFILLPLLVGFSVKRAVLLGEPQGYGALKPAPNIKHPHIFNLKFSRGPLDNENYKLRITEAFEAEGDHVVMIVDKFSTISGTQLIESPLITERAFRIGRDFYEHLEACKARTGKKLLVYIPGNLSFEQVEVQYAVAAGDLICVEPHVPMKKLGVAEIHWSSKGDGNQRLSTNSTHKIFPTFGTNEAKETYINWRKTVLDEMEDELYAAYSRRALANNISFPLADMDEAPLEFTPASLLEEYDSSLGLFDEALTLDEFCTMAASMGVKGFTGDLKKDMSIFHPCVRANKYN
jgi:hypothetical protein